MSNIRKEPELEQWELDEFHLHQVYEREQALYTLRKDRKGNFRRAKISNFRFEVLYFIKGSTASHRIVKLTNEDQLEAIATVNTDSLTAPSEFKKVLQREGNFLFWGSPAQFSHWQIRLFKEEKQAAEIITLGQHANDNFFTFCNGIWQGNRFHAVDEFGIVSLAKGCYCIPYASCLLNRKDNQETSKENENINKFRYTPGPVCFRDWARLFVEVFGENGKVTLAYTIAAVFRDILFRELGYFPHLLASGPPQTGKSSVFESALYLFGEPQARTGLGGASTPKALMRKMAQFRNALVFFDEYKNDIDQRRIESLKNMYDGIGYETAAFSNDNRINTSEILSAVLIAGQELPTNDPALFTRCIHLDFTEKKFNLDAYQQIKGLQAKGLTSVLTQLLGMRSEMERQFPERFGQVFRDLNQQHPGLPDRLLKNYSVLGATARIVSSYLDLSSDVFADFDGLVSRFIRQQYAVMNNTDETQRFFDAVQYLYETGRIHENKDFAFSRDGSVVYLYMLTIHPLYQETLRRQGSTGLEKETLLSYLKANKPLFRKHDNAKFPVMDPLGSKMIYVQKTCLQVNFQVLKSALGISLGKLDVAGEEEKSGDE